MTQRGVVSSDTHWDDGTPRSPDNAFSSPSGLSWAKESQRHRASVVSSQTVSKRRAMGDDPGAFKGLSKKADELRRVHAQELNVRRERRSKGGST